MAVTVRPKESKGALEPVKDTYAVENGVLYDYYPIKLGDRKGDYVTIMKLPPVLKPGYVTYQKELYKVELRDFLRGRVNVGTNFKYVPAEPGATTEPEPANGAVDNASVSAEQQGASPDPGIQIDQAVDMAWEEQIRTLLTLDDPEAQWEFETASQP